MSDVIKLLPDHVANQIAAGEVIQRPASVVKELLDNAVDARSTEIKLIIRDGGKTFIQVLDNGAGMSPTDARLCWERHATSKISSAEDIYSVKTMGFRGEALASIASVSQVELKTKRSEDNLGTLIEIEATEVKKQEPISFQNGTSVKVKNLFFNIPARRNFLKSNPVEARHIIEEFTRAAISHPEIAMSMMNNEEEVFALRQGTQKQRIIELFGNKTEENILHLEEKTTIIDIHGYIGKPEFSRKSRGEQFFFVNKRYIKDAYLNHAVVSSFENLITKEQFPFYIIFIEIGPSKIDVNVHPTKTEIKFEDEKSIYHIVRAVVKKALGQLYHVPVFTPASEDTFLNLKPVPKYPDEKNAEATIRNFNPVTERQNFVTRPSNSEWQQLYNVLQKPETIGTGDKKFHPVEPLAKPEQEDSGSRNILQIQNRFIISQIKSGMMLIDQQAAHERILYEKYISALEYDPISSQQKLFPRTVSLNSSDENLLKEILPDIRLLGFDINELGKNTFVVNGVPTEMNNQDEQSLIEQMLEDYKQQTNQPARRERVARTLAKRACMKAGTKLNTEEMIKLIDELFACREPHLSPDGKICIVKLSTEEMMGMFGRR
ncbi:MAG: DNA mismatch repair endonuclease MutL [Bacteroidia bacterium]